MPRLNEGDFKTGAEFHYALDIARARAAAREIESARALVVELSTKVCANCGQGPLWSNTRKLCVHCRRSSDFSWKARGISARKLSELGAIARIKLGSCRVEKGLGELIVYMRKRSTARDDALPQFFAGVPVRIVRE